jgi:short chain dehydrogenase
MASVCPVAQPQATGPGSVGEHHAASSVRRRPSTRHAIRTRARHPPVHKRFREPRVDQGPLRPPLSTCSTGRRSVVRQLEGRVALVTGSSRGIGAAIARLFAAEGATVAVHGRDHGAVEAIRSDIASAGGMSIGVTGDLTILADLERIVTRSKPQRVRWIS